jgi:amino acid transporter
MVTKENLGRLPSLVAGASLLVDYILTVAVSVAAGVAAITSAVPSLIGLRVPLCLALVLLITTANLRGIKESGALFAGPTYAYIGIMGLLIGWGLLQVWTGHLGPLPVNEPELLDMTGGVPPALLPGASTLVLMKAFSSGAVALTGTEAISDGVPVFRRPESRNAATTLTMMGLILGTYFLGISILAYHVRPTLTHDETILSILGRTVFGGTGPLYVILQAATAMILVLAANTAYADFPRLCSIIARDGFLPRQLVNRGDRLVFSNGVLILAVGSAVLLVAFGGVTNALIPLYAAGVFTSFTLSQSGMLRRLLRLRQPGWRVRSAISLVGAATTGLVLVIVVVSKFTSGAWIPVVLIPLVVMLFKGIHRHYERLSRELHAPLDLRPRRLNHTVVVLVGGIHKGVLQALAYARSLNPNHLLAVNVVSSEEEQERMEREWAEYRIDVPLEILYSPYRELAAPIQRFLDDLDARWDNDIITVVVPEFVVSHWWEHVLHNQSALFLKGRLLFRRNTVVTSIPYHLGGREDVEAGPAP